MMAVEIQIKEIEPQPAVVIEYTATMEQMGQEMGAIFGEIMAGLGQAGASPAGMPFSMYPQMQPDAAGNWQVVSGLPVAQAIPDSGRLKSIELPGGTVAVATHLGPYDTLGQTYKTMEEQIKQQGYQPAGSMWESYFTDPMQEPDPSKWRTDIYWPIRKP